MFMLARRTAQLRGCVCVELMSYLWRVEVHEALFIVRTQF